VLHVRGIVLNALFECKQTKVRQLYHPAGIDQAIGCAQRAVEADGRFVQVDDALRKPQGSGQIHNHTTYTARKKWN